MTLRDDATNIINQPDRTNQDIIDLSKIAYKMAVHYMSARIIAGEQEAMYNLARAKKTREARESWMAVWEAGDVGKLAAEMAHWNYRIMKEESIGMKEILNQIDGFKISYYRREKSIDWAITNKQ